MADRGQDGAERDAYDTDELLCTDLNDNSSVFGLDSSPLKLDQCDLLLDAIDDQLSKLQVWPQKHQGTSRELDCSNAASLSKDTGLGSTTQTNDTPMSCLDLIQTPTLQQTSERSAGCWKDPVMHEETKQKLERRTRDKEEMESQREQIIWRLERLLGDTCNEGGMAGETQPPSDSICTEDFVRRFRDEMVELALPESNMQQPHKEEAERTDISDCDTWQGEQKTQSVLNVDRRVTVTTARNIKTTETAHYSQLNKPCQREELEQCLSDSYGVNISCSDKAGAGERCSTPQRPGDDGIISHTTEVVAEHETLQQNKSHSPKARCLAGVPVWSFDTVSIDSDLDSVCTAQVRKHIHRRPGWHSIIQAVTNVDDYTHQSDYDTPTQEESEPQTISGQRSSHGNAQNRRPSFRKAKRNKRETNRLVYSLGDSDKDTDEEMNHWSRKCRPERTSEKMQADWTKMKERLSTLPQPSVVMTVLEREEMDRQLDSAKTELFAEQRRAREKLESMQEKLEETREELQRVTESESLLRSKCACLEEKRRQTKDQIKAVEFQVGELQHELEECNIRVGTLERMLAQKDLQLLKLQEQHGALQEERDGLRGELQHLKTQHCSALKEAQQQAHKMMEEAVVRQKTDLSLVYQHQIQKVNKQAEEEKANALREQALSLKRHIESLKTSIQLKEEEAKKLRDRLEEQKQEAKSREEELHVETLEMVHKAKEEERRKLEAEQVEAVQVQCGILEEQNRKNLENMRSEMQREKSKAWALQQKVGKLKTRVQELESESCAQQREQESLLAVVCKSLKEEHQAEQQRVQKQMAQESQTTVLQLEKEVQLAEKEADRLRVMLEEKESSHNQITAELEQQLRHWTQELEAECQHLRLLVEQSGAKQSIMQLPPSPAVAKALTNLRTLREQLKNLINHLHQDLDLQRQITERLRKDKERELSIQRQQLRIERDQALDSLKKRLIQEHIEELSSLNYAHMRDGGVEGGRVAASLRKQLKAKDLELRQVQRSMGQWKEQTAARLACKFEEELTAELERKISKDRQKEPERPEGDVSLSAKEAQSSVCSPSHLAAASNSPSDIASFKLLRYLQSRVRQLREENQACIWSPSPLNTVPLDLSGSYLTTITQGQDTAGIQRNSSVKTASS